MGSFPNIPLTDARIKAREFKEQILLGIDPIQQAKDVLQAQIKAQRSHKTFSDAAKDCHGVKKQEFKNAKHANQWISTLETYAYPVIGEMGIDTIEVDDILAILMPIWQTKTETASRLRQRIAVVFDHALASGIRTKANPANWKGCLQPLLPAPEKLKKRLGMSGNHHAALPIDRLNEFFIDLLQYNYMSAQALAFCILTAARSGEVRGMRWDELDIPNAVWRINADRMKAGKTHSVPLSVPALSILQLIERDISSPHVFRNTKGLALSDAIMGKVIRTLSAKQLEQGHDVYIDPVSKRRITPHGFRSCFKDWARTKTNYSDEASELALAHVSSDKTRAAYARDELLDERKKLMKDWGHFCLHGDKTQLRLVNA